jgi:hypothetical protein
VSLGIKIKNIYIKNEEPSWHPKTDFFICKLSRGKKQMQSNIPLVRRCHITCSASTETMDTIAETDEIQLSDSKKPRINFMIAAYNQNTENAEIYFETDRIAQEELNKHLERIGIKSLITIPYSVNWRAQSHKSVERVTALGKQPGYTFIQKGNNSKVSVTGGGTSGGPGGIYVLSLINTSTPFFYVGKATNIINRIEQHTNGTGATCISGEQFTRVDPITTGSIDDMESWERNEVLTRMFEYGISNVRGWMYTLRTMPQDQKLSAFDQICEKFDRCRKCGRGTHFIRDCQERFTATWACGMDLRTAYHTRVQTI